MRAIYHLSQAMLVQDAQPRQQQSKCCLHGRCHYSGHGMGRRTTDPDSKQSVLHSGGGAANSECVMASAVPTQSVRCLSNTRGWRLWLLAQLPSGTAFEAATSATTAH